MEADWEFEVGGDAPLIEALWPGFIDLQRFPERAPQLPEACELPTMAEALARLNGVGSQVWTSKCDVWTVTDRDEFDPDELDAPPGSETHAIACYIDLLPRNDDSPNNLQWSSPEMTEDICKLVCSLLGAVPLRCCRVDLVIRRAFIAPDRMADGMGFGLTAYLTACGPSPAEATLTLQVALAAFTDALRGRSQVE
jgi:hypothetical protein